MNVHHHGLLRHLSLEERQLSIHHDVVVILIKGIRKLPAKLSSK